MYDIILRNGIVVDGTGSPWFRADVAMCDGRIARIAPVINASAGLELDVSDLVVCPGFIDAHAHSDFSIFGDPHVTYKVMQGITTEVNGQCGISAAPARFPFPDDFVRRATPAKGKHLEWPTFSDYLKSLDETRTAINILSMAGHGAIRRFVAEYRENLTADEFSKMQGIVAEAMQAGVFGLSSGLVYAPGCYAETAEVAALCRVVAKYGGLYATHARGLRETLVEGLEEAITIGREAAVPVQVSHHMPQFGGWGLCSETLSLVDEARASGVDVTLDLHLDTVGSTNLLATIPPWAKAHGLDWLSEKLGEKDFREKLKAEMREFTGPGTSGFIKHERYDIIRIAGCRVNDRLLGKTLQQIGEEMGKEPLGALLDLLREEKTGLHIAGPYCDADDLKAILKHPAAMVATDADPIAMTGTHRPPPRNFSTFPRVLGTYVREEGILSIEEAIRKMTGFPAARFRLEDRGILKQGLWADITVFDRDRIAEGATDEEYLLGEEYRHPVPVGVEYVFVNGVPVCEGGKPTENLPGKVLRFFC